MASNLDRFAKDLDRLIEKGRLLHTSMQRACYPNKVDDEIVRKVGKDKAQSIIKSLPCFEMEYDGWYSEALALLKQLLPDRVVNFVSFYEKPRARKTVEFGNYVIQDYLLGLQVKLGTQTKVDGSAAIPQFTQQLAIVQAAKVRFQSSLFELRQLVQADLFDSEMAAARELQKHKFYRAAGVMSGVVLEKHLHQVCLDRNIPISKKNPSLSDLAEALKSNGAIDIPQWRHLSLVADIRNLCAHNKQKEPSAEQIEDLIGGTEKIIKTVS